MRCPAFVCISALAGLALVAGRAGGQDSTSSPADTDWVRSDTLIPMRDGVRLFTVILVPRNAASPLPILINRSPYGAKDYAPKLAKQTQATGLDGYILVLQDIRGRYRSEGTFDMTRPLHVEDGKPDESTDAYDTIDWLVKHVPHNNGRVGLFGVSYDGQLAAAAAIGAHPALKAISPQAPPGDLWMGDDYFHQGAFRLSMDLEFAWWMEASPYRKDPCLTVQGLPHNVVVGIIRQPGHPEPRKGTLTEPGYKYADPKVQDELICLSSGRYPIRFEAPRTGELWVVINDVDEVRWDNTGLFFLKVVQET